MTEHYTMQEAVELARECGGIYPSNGTDDLRLSPDRIHTLINTAVTRKLAAAEERTKELVSLLYDARNDCEQVLHSYLPHAGYERYNRLIAYQKDLIARIDAAIEAEKVRG